MTKNRMSKIISIVLYPAITGTIFVFILFLGIMGLNFKSFFFAIIYASLIALVPFLIVKHLEKSGKIGDQDITIKEERKIFFQTSFPFYIAAFLFLFLVRVPKPIFLMGSGIMAFVIIYYLISPIYKISIHVGGLAFDIIALGLVVNKSFYFLSPLLLLLVWSRHHLGKHTLGQSILGAIIGGGIPMALLNFL